MIRHVLLVCTGNTCRSPMAEGLLKQLWAQSGAGWDLLISSAGTGAIDGDRASEHAVTVMKGLGFDLSGHRSRSLRSDVISQADLILTMTGRHKQHLLMLRPDLGSRVFTLGEYAGIGQEVSDPYGGSLTDYKNTATDMEVLLKAIVERIKREGAGTK